MKVAVMGAGAVGCYYGGMLARAGHDVVLIGRAQHVDAIRAQGLRLDTQSFDERVRVAASTDAHAAAGAQLVLFCVKSTDTESAAQQLRPHLAQYALILTLQNGVDNPERIRRNLDVFSFELSGDEMDSIAALDTADRFGGDPTTHEEF